MTTFKVVEPWCFSIHNLHSNWPWKKQPTIQFQSKDLHFIASPNYHLPYYYFTIQLQVISTITFIIDHPILPTPPQLQKMLAYFVGCLAGGREHIASCCRELIVLPGACVYSLDTYFNLSPLNHLYVLLVIISYQARFCLQISYPAILFTMLMGFLNRGSFIIHILLLGTSNAFTLSVFPAGHVRSHHSARHMTIYAMMVAVQK